MRPKSLLAAVVLALLLGAAASAQAAPPQIANTTASAITTTSATLQATLDPQGKATTYHFEWGTADCSANPCTALPDGHAIPGASPPVTVEAPLAGLSPASAYHFRLVAEHSGESPLPGPDTSFSTYPEPQSFGPCPNDSLRSGAPSALLPDCRAYEQISPVNKGGQDITGYQPFTRSSPDGSAAAFLTSSGLPGIGLGGQEPPSYVSRRTPDGWTTTGTLPPATFGESAHMRGWTPDFETVFSSLRHIGNLDATLLSAPFENTPNILVPYGSGLGAARTDGESEPSYTGSSSDGTLSYFESEASLPGTAGLQGKTNVYGYDSTTATLFLAGQMNDQAPPAQGAIGGPYDWIGSFDPANPTSLSRGGAATGYYTQEPHAVSASGDLFFTEAGSGQLYERLNPEAPQSAMIANSTTHEEECTEPTKACTIHISATEKTTGHGPGGSDSAGTRPAAFLAASPDGSSVLFTSSEKLTNDATTAASEPEHEPAIASADIDGTNVDNEALPTHAEGLAVFGDHIYWADPSEHAIGRAKLNPETGQPEEPEPHFILPGPTEFETHPFTEPGVMHSAPSTPRYVAVDEGHVYWTNTGPEGGEKLVNHVIEAKPGPIDMAGTIGRAQIDGAGNLVLGSVESEFIIGASNPQGIAIDTGDIYWANDGLEEGNGCDREYEPPECVGNEVHPTQTLSTAELPNGNNVEQLKETAPKSGGGTELRTLAAYAGGLTRDDRYLYFAENQEPTHSPFCSLNRYDLLARNVESVAGSNTQTADANCFDIKLRDGVVYWTADTANAGTVNRAEIGGGEVDRDFVPHPGSPLGLALDGDHIYWAANQSVQPNSGNDIYRYSAQPDAEGHHLTDLSVDINPADPNGAEVKGILGASEDLSYVYIAANGDLDEGGPGEGGDCKGSIESSFDGQCSLYLLHGGQVQFIAPVDAQEDFADWLPRRDSGRMKAARATPGGQALLFTSASQLTPYDNNGVKELYLFHFGDPTPISCVSCNPTGQGSGFSQLNGQNLGFPSVAPVNYLSETLTRNLSADGNRVFFETTEALVPADTNGENGCPLNTDNGSSNAKLVTCLDVYEWEAPGTGSCEEGKPPYTPTNAGCLYLLSSGTEEQPSFFLDASTSGNDAFIITRSPLVGQDGDQLADAYDVRAQGGLTSQNETPVPGCEAEGCKPDPSTPPPPTPCASACFAGPANPPAKHGRCPKGSRHKKHKGKVRCVKPKGGKRAKRAERAHR